MSEWGHGFLRPPASRDTDARDQRDRETWRQSDASRGLPPPRSEGDTIGDFVLGPLLGRGSSGYVYRALDSVTGRSCALKLIGIDEPKTLVRLKLGFRRMMTVHHPNLVRVDRIHHLDDLVVLSMEEVEGETFREVGKRFSQLDRDAAFERLVGLTRDYASALAMMHSQGYVHRDIKPANLMVERTGKGVVIDYGLVGTFDPETDPSGARGYFVGTPMYVAPEVLWSQHHGPASDIFSLGMVVMEAIQWITGCRVIARSETSRVEDRTVLGTMIDGISEEVPEVLRDACVEMLEFDPADRPTSMRIARLGLPPSATPLPMGGSRLFGRDAERDEMRRWIDSIFAGGTGRLHLTGRSGIGKSRLVEELVATIESKRWGQVFHARCQRREDQPMQAFGQITDAIVARYSRDDRDALQVDPASYSILTMAFPALRAVLEANLHLPPIRETSTRLDALEAGGRLSAELRQVGPLFLVIDDVQWADRDSLNVLDRLQTLPGGMLGLVTVSCDGVDEQRVPPSHTIELKPLSNEDGVAILAEASARWNVDVDPALLRQLAESTEGCPHRLAELANEFRPGSVLADQESGDPVTRVDQVWERRMGRLSERAVRILRSIVTAGRTVSIEQLGELSGRTDAVEAAISELVQQGLVTDEASGGECIAVKHDSVADRLIATLGQADRRRAHKQWARLLMRSDRPEELAARIAKHLIDAGEPGRAVSYAILAAEDAERRLATTEAGYWHKRVIPYASGAEKVERIRRAAKCFDAANRPEEAARLYHQLAALVDEPERFECELRSVTLLIRSGRWEEARARFTALARRVGVPRPRSPRLATWALLLRAARFRFRVPTLRRIASVGDPQSLASHREPPPDVRRRIRTCLALERPLSMFDNALAAELNMAGATDAIRFGTPQDKLYAAIGVAVFGCYDRGRRREAGEKMLADLETPIRNLGDPKLAADLLAGVAISHACSCRWADVPEAVRRGVEGYQSITPCKDFETAHTRWAAFWAYFHLGRIGELAAEVDETLDDAMHRRDRFGEFVATLGMAAAARLARDEPQAAAVTRENLVSPVSTGNIEFMDVYRWISETQSEIYCGDWDAASDRLRSIEHRLKQMPYSRLQLLRVQRSTFEILLRLRRFAVSRQRQTRISLRRDLGRLRGEQLPFASTFADLAEGTLDGHVGEPERALERLSAARDRAAQQGLRPWRLAAEDAILGVQTGRHGERLRRALEKQGVADPERFERLYTVRLDDDANPPA